MVEISKSGSGEGLGGVIPRGYSKDLLWVVRFGRFCCKVWDHARESVRWTSLRGQSEHFVDQLRLPDHVTLRHPSRLSLAERMHDLDAAQGPPRRGE